jgi:hypothetical protein
LRTRTARFCGNNQVTGPYITGICRLTVNTNLGAARYTKCYILASILVLNCDALTTNCRYLPNNMIVGEAAGLHASAPGAAAVALHGVDIRRSERAVAANVVISLKYHAFIEAGTSKETGTYKYKGGFIK